MPPRWRESQKRDPCTLPLADSARAAGPELASAAARASAWARPAFPPGERRAPPRGPARGFGSGASRAAVGRCPRPLPGPVRRCGPPRGAHSPSLLTRPAPHGHCLRPGSPGLGAARPRPPRGPFAPLAGPGPLGSDLPPGGTERGPGLAAGGGGGGGASRPSDHLW